MTKTSERIELTPKEQEQMERWATAHGTPQQVALRCRLVLAAAGGQQELDIDVFAFTFPKQVRGFINMIIVRMRKESDNIIYAIQNSGPVKGLVGVTAAVKKKQIVTLILRDHKCRVVPVFVSKPICAAAKKM